MVEYPIGYKKELIESIEMVEEIAKNIKGYMNLSQSQDLGIYSLQKYRQALNEAQEKLNQYIVNMK